MVDWGTAGALAGKGFGTVFAVLVILAVVTWLMGFVAQRIKKSREEAALAAKVEKPEVK
ncbi:MAG: OadG family protein [Dehalococcoidia bacterium]|nr:OadG family protein [Dehalococcoidia bacterium]